LPNLGKLALRPLIIGLYARQFRRWIVWLGWRRAVLRRLVKPVRGLIEHGAGLGVGNHLLRLIGWKGCVQGFLLYVRFPHI